jgi:hypothetical protein
MHPTQDIYLDEEGINRFKCNQIVRILLSTSVLDLNKLSQLGFSVEDWDQFIQLLGYSIDGWGEMDHVTDEMFVKVTSYIIEE